MLKRVMRLNVRIACFCEAKHRSKLERRYCSNISASAVDKFDSEIVAEDVGGGHRGERRRPRIRLDNK